MCEEDKYGRGPARKSMVETARGYFELFCGVGKKVFDFLDGPGLQQMQTRVANARNQLQLQRPLAIQDGGNRKKLRTQKKNRRV
jgi:hypothetical protein